MRAGEAKNSERTLTREQACILERSLSYERAYRPERPWGVEQV